MADLTAIADENGLPFALSPSGDFGGSVGRLKDFYSRFGFVPNKGRNKDFRISESYVRNPSQPPAPKGIKAYHGSPHSFEKFEWSPKTRGTGEGAQAYGDGLYFAENEGVAKGYRDTLSGSMVSGAQKRLEKAGGDVDMAIADVQSRIDNYRANGAPQYADAIEEDLRGLLKFKETGEWTPGSMYEVNIDADPNAFLDWDKPLSEQPEAVRNAIDPLMKKMMPDASAAKVVSERGPVPADKRNGGYVRPDDYFVNLEIPGKGMVSGFGKSRDEAFQSALQGFVPEHGAGFYNALARGLDGSAGQTFGRGSQPTSQALAEAGIPGIKFLDAGSRVPSAMAKKELADWQAQLPLAEKELADATARGDKWLASRKQAEVQRVRDGISRVSQEADGTRNYVVFDDKLISIVKKYGIAGASAMLGYNVMTGANEAQAKAVNKADLDHRYDNFLKSGGI